MSTRWLLLAIVLVVVGGCGNPGGLSDEQYIAKLRNEREAWEKSWNEQAAQLEARIAAEQERQRRNSNR
jgi:hypothetical protein